LWHVVVDRSTLKTAQVFSQGLLRAWNWPTDTNCVLLYLLRNPLGRPVLDELATRCIRFIQRCLLSECQLVKFLANSGIRAGRMLSPMEHNAFFCCQRFNVSVDDVLHLSAAGVIRHCHCLKWLLDL